MPAILSGAGWFSGELLVSSGVESGSISVVVKKS